MRIDLHRKILRRLKRIYLAARGLRVDAPEPVKRIPNPVSTPLLQRFEFLVQEAGAVLPEYRFKWPQMDWWEDRAFTAYLARFDELKTFNSDRRWMVYQLSRLVASVPGDTAECGVFTGSSSFILCKANQGGNQPRTHHIFDSFEGVSEPGDQDGTHWSRGDLACGLEQVRENLSDFDPVLYYPGWIPERFNEIADKRFAFVHIDVDLYEPTRDSINFFYPLLSPGGILLCDDYGFNTCPGATKALDECLADKQEKAVSLSGGGGFFIKGTETAPRFF